jgi:hypothetical protein
MEETKCFEDEIGSQRKEEKKRENILTDHIKERSKDFKKIEA